MKHVSYNTSINGTEKLMYTANVQNSKSMLLKKLWSTYSGSSNESSNKNPSIHKLWYTFCQLVGINQPVEALTTTAGLSSVAQFWYVSG